MNISTFCDRTIALQPAETIVVPAATNTQIIPDMSRQFEGASARWIQNIGGQSANIAIGQDCDGGRSIHFVLPANQSLPLDISLFGLGRVMCYSTSGTTIAVLVARRQSFSQISTNVNPTGLVNQ